MSQTTTELKKEFQKSLELMRTLRDEVTVKLHLAGMDAKEEWKKLEPQLRHVEQAATSFTEATHHALSETVKRLSALRDSLK